MTQDTRPDETADAALERLPARTRIGVVASSYHAELVGAMAASARRVLTAAGLADEDWLELAAPGTFELPLIARRLARRDDVDAVLCFGLVLRGETDHDRYISSAVSTRLVDAALETDTPILFGVLTPNTLGQARRRARPREDGGLDKGREVALATIRVVNAMVEADRVGRPRAQR